MSAQFFQVPAGSIFARYAPAPAGGVQVVSSSGQILGGSFFELRHRFSFGGVVAGAGAWVVLVNRFASFPQVPAVQPSLF